MNKDLKSYKNKTALFSISRHHSPPPRLRSKNIDCNGKTTEKKEEEPWENEFLSLFAWVFTHSLTSEKNGTQEKSAPFYWSLGLRSKNQAIGLPSSHICSNGNAPCQCLCFWGEYRGQLYSVCPCRRSIWAALSSIQWAAPVKMVRIRLASFSHIHKSGYE